MSADIILHKPQENISLQVPTNIGDIERYANIFAKSGYFMDAKEMAQAAVKIIAGAECGIKPFASMNGIYIVKGRTSMSANLMATLVKTSGRYNYRIVEITASNCKIDFYEHGEPIGSSPFSIEDARRAGTQNLDKFARNMLFARAMSNGVRWYCPDVTAGPMYTPEELGAEVDGEGEMIALHTIAVQSVETVSEGQAAEDPLTSRRSLAVKTWKKFFTPDGLKNCLPEIAIMRDGTGKILVGTTFANLLEDQLEAVEKYMATPTSPAPVEDATGEETFPDETAESAVDTAGK